MNGRALMVLRGEIKTPPLCAKALGNTSPRRNNAVLVSRLIAPFCQVATIDVASLRRQPLRLAALGLLPQFQQQAFPPTFITLV